VRAVSVAELGAGRERALLRDVPPRPCEPRSAAGDRLHLLRGVLVAGELSISFEGAARTVTGSRHRIRFGERQWLFDCGLYQGHRDEAEAINRSFRFEPEALDAIVVSHAHLDHTGNLPTLVARGYAGRIHATPSTIGLAQVMLRDSAFLMQRDVEHVNRHRRGRPERVPLY